jgi:AraC-like DNA-binding protein
MKDQVRYKQIAAIPGLELSQAKFAEFDFEPHFHFDFHIGLVTQGIQNQQINGKTFHLLPGSISLVPPGEVHDGLRGDDAGYALRTFRLSPDLLADLNQVLRDSERAPLDGSVHVEQPELAGRLASLHAAMQDDGVAPMALQSEWLILLDRLLAQSGVAAPSGGEAGLSALQWQRVRDYCHANLSEKITLDELAALCGLERYAFLRRFARMVGMTPHAWLLRLRLEYACSRLRAGKEDLATIAHGAGFYDQSHFYRAFRQAYGVSPSAYSTR